MTVYKAINSINGKVYIGQTRQKLGTRWLQHCSNKSNSKALKAAIKKYGKDVFTMEILCETVCPIVLNYKEKAFIKEYNSFGADGYNLTSGGEGGYVRSEETKTLLREANKGKGRPHTAETKAKLSALKKGVNNHMFGKKVSDEHKAKISAALMGRKRPPEVIAKIKANHNPKSNLNLTHNR